jgi:hypothetical protein
VPNPSPAPPLPSPLAAGSAGTGGTVALVVVAVALFLGALIVRRIIRLALLVAVAGLVVLAVAAWHAGVFGD